MLIHFVCSLNGSFFILHRSAFRGEKMLLCMKWATVYLQGRLLVCVFISNYFPLFNDKIGVAVFVTQYTNSECLLNDQNIIWEFKTKHCLVHYQISL